MGNKKRAKQALFLLLAPVRNKRAASLVIVLVSFAVLMVVGVSLLSIVSYNHKNAADYHRKQQAEYTARGVMEAIVEAFDKPTTGNGKAILEKVEALGTGNTLEGAGSMADANMGEYKVELTLVKPEEIKAVVIATYQGMSYKVSAHFEKNTGGNTLDPFEFLFFMGEQNVDIIGSGTDKTVLDGNVYMRGSANFSNIVFGNKMLFTGSGTANNCTFNGDVISISPLTGGIGNEFKGNQWYVGKLDGSGVPITNDSIGFDQFVMKYQRQWSKINYLFTANTVVDINGIKMDYNDKSYTLPDSSVIPHAQYGIEKTYVCDGFNIQQSGGKLTFVGGDYDGDYITMVIDNHRYTATDGSYLDFGNMSYLQEYPELCVGPPDTSGMGTKSLAGEITSGDYVCSGGNSAGLILNTTDGDINIYINSDVTINGDVTVKGEHNAVFHMDSHNFTIGSGAKVGLSSEVDKTQIYVEGKGSNIFDMQGNSQFKGMVYFPKGRFTESGTTTKNRLAGSITAKEATIQHGSSYQYVKLNKKPEFKTVIMNNGDPSKPYFVYPPTSGSSGDNWTLIGYY